MSKKVQTRLLKYGITGGICLCLVAIYCVARDFSGLELVEKYRTLCDAFTIPGVLSLCVGVLIWASNDGIFYGLLWRYTTDFYAWSSPVSLYTTEGKGYLALPTASGKVWLYDAATGEALASENLGSNIEASPVVYENTLVIGTRGQQIYGVKFK